MMMSKGLGRPSELADDQQKADDLVAVLGEPSEVSEADGEQ